MRRIETAWLCCCFGHADTGISHRDTESLTWSSVLSSNSMSTRISPLSVNLTALLVRLSKNLAQAQRITNQDRRYLGVALEQQL